MAADHVRCHVRSHMAPDSFLQSAFVITPFPRALLFCIPVESPIPNFPTQTVETGIEDSLEMGKEIEIPIQISFSLASLKKKLVWLLFD